MPLRLPADRRTAVLQALKSLGSAQTLANAVWERTGLDLADEVDLHGGRNAVFTEVMRIAEAQGWLEAVLRAALSYAPHSVPLREVLDGLGLPELPRPEKQQLPDGLVAADNKALQALIVLRRPAMLLADFSRRLEEISRAVCWIGLSHGLAGDANPQWGTGFLVAPDLVLTNHHVVAPLLRQQAEPSAVVCRFDRLSVTAGASGETVELAAQDWCVASSPHAPSDVTAGAREPKADELDFCLLRLKRALVTRAPLQVPAEPAPLLADDLVFVVQHPAEALDAQEGAQRIAVGRVLGFDTFARRVRHDVSAMPGSSGSPALTADLQVAALHHGTQPLRTAEHGLVARRREFNRAIPLRPILRLLRRDPDCPAFWHLPS